MINLWLIICISGDKFLSTNFERKVGAVQFFGHRSSSQEVAGYNEPGYDCHAHKFLPAVVKLDLINCSSGGKIKLWHDNDQFQVRSLLLCSIPQNEESPLFPQSLRQSMGKKIPFY